MYAIQHDLFEDNSDIGILKQDNAELRKSVANIRKGIFSRYHDLEKKLLSLQDEVERLRGIVAERKAV